MAFTSKLKFASKVIKEKGRVLGLDIGTSVTGIGMSDCGLGWRKSFIA